MERALKLSQKINEALAVHDKKVRPNAGGKNSLQLVKSSLSFQLVMMTISARHNRSSTPLSYS